MSIALETRPVLVDRIPGARVRDAAVVVGGAGLVALCSQISIHVGSLSPVPFNLGTFAVLLVGAALGPVRAFASLAMFVAAGAAGAPVYADGASGFGGVTYGYIIGYVLAAVVMGALARRGADRHVLTTFGQMALGTAIIYSIGVPWLAYAGGMSMGTAVEKGMLIFLVTDAAKALIAAALLPATWKLLGSER